jgi:hypothetical protein
MYNDQMICAIYRRHTKYRNYGRYKRQWAGKILKKGVVTYFQLFRTNYSGETEGNKRTQIKLLNCLLAGSTVDFFKL